MMDEVGNPFSQVKTIRSFDELIDSSFNKAMKIKPPMSRQDPLGRTKTFELNRINTAANVLVNNLENIVTNFPSLNLIHPFYLELASIVTDVDDLRRSLGRVFGVVNNIRDLEEEIKDKIMSKKSKEEVKQQRKIAFARFSSMVKRIRSSLLFLNQASEQLKLLPGFNPYDPTVVICGFPNTGKSSFIRLTTSGKPEVASYPFTTKKIIFGHRKFGFVSVQFVDTPGLLDRPLHERNSIELHALAVFKHLADILVFLFDVAKSSAHNLQEQINLFKEIKKFYPGSSFLPVIAKSDLLSKDQIIQIKEELIKQEIVDSMDDVWNIHTIEPDGVSDLINFIGDKVKNEILHNSKFKQASSIKIADDQLTFDEMDDDLFI